MDVLTDILDTMHLQSHVQYSMELMAPWGIAAPAIPNAAIFFAIARGSCYLEVDKHEMPIPLVGGDLVMLPQGNAHIICDQPGSPVTPLKDLPEICSGHHAHKALRFGGDGSPTEIVVGCFIFEHLVSGLFLSVLPSVIHIQGERGQMAPGLETTLRWIARETNSQRPGTSIMISRLTDMLFVQILRVHIAEHTEPNGQCQRQAGLLCALADPSLRQTFELIHGQTAQTWTVAKLASKVNMSRTAFSTRFTQLAGMPPLTYLTRWRMLKAGDLLRQSTSTITEIAACVGYKSEASFSKAFKREMDMAPGAFRRKVQREGRHAIENNPPRF